jgi:hypothetical protein
MINATFNTPNNKITTSTITTERVTLPRADEATRDRFSAHFTASIWNAGWSLAGLRGTAAKYKGRYYATLCNQLARAVAEFEVVGFAYDKERKGEKRPWIIVDGSPVWAD